MKSRYAIYTVFLLLGMSGYYVHLLYYLQQISNPYPLVTVFFGSLIVASFSEFTEGLGRLMLAGVGATMMYFIIATEIAIFAREIVLMYLDANILSASLDIQLQLGQEYIQSARNKIVSVGACMAVSLIVSKFLFYKMFRRMFLILLNAHEVFTTSINHD